MRYRIFGKTGWQVSEVGLGTWQLGPDWGGVDEATAQEILATAVERGVNFFDTADVYGSGLSESRIGRFLKDSRPNIFVATKLGRFPQPGWPHNWSYDWFARHTEASLKRLGREVIDLTQLHCVPSPFLRSGDGFIWLKKLQKAGKIRHFAASVETIEDALFCLKEGELISLQIIFNLFRQSPAKLLFKAAQESNVALIVRLPLASGLLTGKFAADTSFKPTDHRFYNANGECFNVGETFSGLSFEEGLRLTEGLKAFVPEGMSLLQMALRWILDFEAVSTIIPGATRPQQVSSNVAISSLAMLPAEVHDKLGVYYREKVVPHIRGKH